MEQDSTPLFLTQGKGNTAGVNSHFSRIDFKADMKQHRRLQNRKNQRARRQRIKEQAPGYTQSSRPFQVSRWRLDELDNRPSTDASSAPQGPMATHICHALPQTDDNVIMPLRERAGALQALPAAPVDDQISFAPPSFIFPLSTDHLLHLIQYNVFRAFISNKRTLNLLLTGWTQKPFSPNACPISGPYRDDTSVYPLNPNIPPSLVPTRLQQTCSHSIWINLFPFPCIRDNLIRREGTFDHWELLQDLIGELMSMTPTQNRRGTPQTITISAPTNTRNSPLSETSDDDEITAGRKGLIVWGEPYDMRNWEATPAFFTKWSWAVEGCNDIIISSNYWRRMRGEEPLRIKL